MKYKGKYNLSENLFQHRGMGLLKEGFAITDQFLADVDAFLTSNDRADLNTNPKAVVGDAGELLLRHVLPGGINMNEVKGIKNFPLVDLASNNPTPENIAAGRVAFYAVKASSALSRTGRGVDATTSSPVNASALRLLLGRGGKSGLLEELDMAFPEGFGQIMLGCYSIDLGTKEDDLTGEGGSIVSSIIIEKNGPKTWQISRGANGWELENPDGWPMDAKQIAGKPELARMFGPLVVVAEHGYQGTDIIDPGTDRTNPRTGELSGDAAPGFAIQSSDARKFAGR